MTGKSALGRRYLAARASNTTARWNENEDFPIDSLGVTTTSFLRLAKLPIGSILSAKWRIEPMNHAAIRPAIDPGVGQTAPNLSDASARERLTPSAVDGMVRLAEIWRLTGPEVCALLGDVSERTWFRMKKGEWSGTLSQDALTRIGALVGIFKGLRLLFSQPLSDEWVRLPNKGPLYAGRRPLDAMIEGGIPKMLEVRRHIDALRGGL